MICPRCKVQLPDNSVACNRCGLMFQYQMPPQQQMQSQFQQQYQPQPQQKKSTKKLIIGLVCGIVGAILLSFLIPLIISYIPKEIDYGDDVSFEKALNKGENCVGKVVQFKIKEFKTPLGGYNCWAGEHLNFVSVKNPGYSKGDIVTVKVTKVVNLDGKWQIWYKKVKNGKETSRTIKSD